ncbi:hypothetical protein RHORCCE3_0001 [Rickettsia hoogstraalii str. RCCE3]|nr:hypothetical protein RHORCCE3_0001 [Rickettsia hoogstraalii str. RCCE3]
MQIYYNNSIDELQETYHFFEEHLSVCQRRVRQCLLELEQSGFINLSTSTIIKYGIKCRNTPCVKLAKNFQPYNHKSSAENEKNLSTTRKIFRPNPKEISAQPEKNFANYLYIDNNKNISNKSRSSESTIFQNEKNASIHNNQQQLQQQKLAADSQFKATSSINDQQQDDNTNFSSANITTGATRINTVLQAVINKISKNMTLHHQIAIMQQLMPLIIKAGSKEKINRFPSLTQEEADLYR